MGRTKGSYNSHCKYDHVLQGVNLYIYPDGHRACLLCKRRENKRWNVLRVINNNSRKLRVLTHYGPRHHLKCCWKGCPIADIDMLSLDHINNDGAKHREKLTNGKNKRHGGGGRSAYRDVEKRGFPPGFQTLCFNHQMKKQFMLRKKR
jgi:hypothetical protein